MQIEQSIYVKCDKTYKWELQSDRACVEREPTPYQTVVLGVLIVVKMHWNPLTSAVWRNRLIDGHNALVVSAYIHRDMKNSVR